MSTPARFNIVRCCAAEVWCIALLTLTPMLTIGCTSRSVTNQKKYHVGFIPNEIYRLKADRDLVHAEWDPSDLYSFIPPGAAEGQAADWLDLIGSVKAGTRVLVDELRYETLVNLSDVYRTVAAYGRIMDPPHTGLRVELSGVSNFEPFPHAALPSRVMMPNLELIDKVDDP